MTGVDAPERCLVHRAKLIAAARGQVDAQRHIAMAYYSDACALVGMPAAFAVLQALVWARIVEANTRSMGDAAFLAHFLALASDISEEIGDLESAEDLRAEMLGLLDRVADMPGGEEADTGLIRIAAICPPETVEKAKLEKAYYDAG